MTDAYLATSSDGGKTFTNARVSSQSFDSRVGPIVDPKLPVDFGSRLGLTSTDKLVVGAWTDSRQGNEDTGRQDIAAAAATVAPRPPDRTRLAEVLGLLGLSLLGLLGWAVSGRRSRRSRSEVRDASVL
jgi:hypothetical protein